jgi:exonuclease III
MESGPTNAQRTTRTADQLAQEARRGTAFSSDYTGDGPGTDGGKGKEATDTQVNDDEMEDVEHTNDTWHKDTNMAGTGASTATPTEDRTRSDEQSDTPTNTTTGATSGSARGTQDLESDDANTDEEVGHDEYTPDSPVDWSGAQGNSEEESDSGNEQDDPPRGGRAQPKEAATVRQRLSEMVGGWHGDRLGEYKGMVAISLNTGGKMAVWDSKNNRDPSSRTPFILDITDTSVADIVGITETKLGPKQARDIDKLIKMEGRPSVAIHATTSKATSAVLATDDTLGGTTVREGGVSIVIGPRLAHLVQDWETLADGRILVVYLSCREDWWNDPNTVVVVCFYGVSGATTKDKKSVASEVGAQLRKIVGDNEGRILVMMGDSNNVVRSADRRALEQRIKTHPLSQT